MASIIPGYEYDIFISYRQKDNKGDRWVSEFFRALMTRLKSKFKDEFSRYHIQYQQDGFLETCGVKASPNENLNYPGLFPLEKSVQNNPAKYETTNIASVRTDSQYFSCKQLTPATNGDWNCDRCYYRQPFAWR